MAQNIKRPESIPGYEHPGNIKYATSNKIYKTFTEGKKAKKDEKFGNTSLNKGYCTIGTDEEVISCPICDEDAVKTCPCSYTDKQCQNGHTWYTNRDGKTIKGNPHK